MWIKYYSNGKRIVQGKEQGQTWLTTSLDNLIKVEMVLPQELFGSNYRVFLSGPGPYNHAIKASSMFGGNILQTKKLAEYIQRYNGQGWLTIEADFKIGKIKQYITTKKFGF